MIGDLPVPGLGLLGGAGSTIAGDVVGAVFHQAFTAIVGSVASAAGWITGSISPDADRAVEAVTSSGEMVAMRQVAEFVMAPLLFVASAGAVLRRDGARLARAWCALPVAVFATFAAHTLVAGGCALVDWMDQQVAGPALPTDLAHLVGKLAPLTIGSGGAVGAIIAGVALLALVLLWLELVVRAAAVALVVGFLPLVFATAVWPAMLGVTRRAVETLAALVVSKFVVVAALVLGVSVVDAASGPGADAIGLGVLLITAFAPMAVLRLVPVVDAAAIGHLEGRARQPLRAAVDTAARAQTVAPMVGALGRAIGHGGSDTGAAVARAAGDVPGSSGAMFVMAEGDPSDDGIHAPVGGSGRP